MLANLCLEPSQDCNSDPKNGLAIYRIVIKMETLNVPNSMDFYCHG